MYDVKRTVHPETRRGGVYVTWVGDGLTKHYLTVYPYSYGGKAHLNYTRALPMWTVSQSIQLFWPPHDRLSVTDRVPNGPLSHYCVEGVDRVEWAAFFFGIVPFARHTRRPWGLLTWMKDDAPFPLSEVFNCDRIERLPGATEDRPGLPEHPLAGGVYLGLHDILHDS